MVVDNSPGCHIFLHVHLETLVPVRVQGLFHDGGGVCLIAIDGDHSKWVRQA